MGTRLKPLLFKNWFIRTINILRRLAFAIDDDYNEVEWELEMLSDEGDYWEVRATVVKTDRPRKFKKGWYIDFQLDKDTSVNDIDYYLLQAVEEERGGAWSSGH